MKKSVFDKRKLRLASETIRLLADIESGKVRAGTAGTSISTGLPETHCSPCT